MKKMVKSKEEYLVESLIAAPSLSSALYILYWNLDLNAKALNQLGDLRLLINKEEARIYKQYENTLSPNCSRHCEIKKLCVCGEVFTQRHYDYMEKEKGKVDEYYVKGEEVLSPFGDGNWDAEIIHNDG